LFALSIPFGFRNSNFDLPFAMSVEIHSTAIVDPAAQLGDGTVVGPYCVVAAEVSLGESNWLQNHVTVAGPLRTGRGNKFFAYCSIGQQTQDLKYEGEPTWLEIGDDNAFREFCTVNRSTFATGKTVVGSRCNFLAYSHIGHDCVVGDGVVFSNNGTLGGHAQVGDGAVIGGLTAIHQFCRIGRFAITGGCSKIVQDVPPFMIADGNPAEVRGINQVGLERAGYVPEKIKPIKEAFRILYRGEMNTHQALGAIRERLGGSEEAQEIVSFVEASTRGIIR
jgi:UDP-N-acetylglucosamine acyltransferase